MIHIITGKIDGNGIDVVTVDGEALDVTPSLKLRSFCPEFGWGDGGSAAAQLSLAILLKIVPQFEAVKWFQLFKWRVIANLEKGKEFSIPVDVAAMLGEFEREGSEGI